MGVLGIKHSITKPVPKAPLGILLLGLTLLTACSSPQPRTAPEPFATSTAVASDPQQCLSEVECSLKTARTLLFVYDYASLGAPLMQHGYGHGVAGQPVDTPALRHHGLC